MAEVGCLPAEFFAESAVEVAATGGAITFANAVAWHVLTWEEPSKFVLPELHPRGERWSLNL